METTRGSGTTPDIDLSKLIGDNVRVFREANGLTQRELAERLSHLGWSVDNTAVARIEAGSREMRAGQVALMAQALGRGPGELYEADRTARASMALGTLMRIQTGMQAAVVDLLLAKDQLTAAMESLDEEWESAEYAERLISASPVEIVKAIQADYQRDRARVGVRSISGRPRDYRTYSGNEMRAEVLKYLEPEPPVEE